MEIRQKAFASLLALSLAIPAILSGCGSVQGNYTRAATSAAKEKMAAMKSAMEWQSAKQQLLGNDTEKALKSIDRSLALNPNVAKSHVLKGRILMEQGDLDGALTWFGSAQAIEPENVEASYYAGVVNERLRQSDAALANYRRAAELEPSNPQYIVAATEILIDQGKLSEAEAELNTRQTQFAHNAGVNQTRGHIAALRGQHEAALGFFEEARLAAPDDPAIQSDLIAAQIACEKYADAELAIARLLKNKEYSERRDLQLMRARCLVQVERAIEARDLLIKLTNSEGGTADVESWIELGKVSFKLKDFNRARTAAARLVPNAQRATSFGPWFCVGSGRWIRPTRTLFERRRSHRTVRTTFCSASSSVRSAVPPRLKRALQRLSNSSRRTLSRQICSVRPKTARLQR